MSIVFFVSFFFNDTATTEIYTLSLHDALPISTVAAGVAIMITIVASASKLTGRIFVAVKTATVEIGRAHV